MPGYSKFGRFSGNENADGTFIQCGFRPAFVIVKRFDAGQDSHWYYWDNERDGYNGAASNDAFLVNSNSAELDAGRIDLLSNGFKIRNADGDINGTNCIFLAWADVPFKYANAR